MKQSRRYRKTRKRRRFFVLVLAIFLLLGFAIFHQRGYRRHETTYPSLDTYRKTITGEGFPIFEEKIYRAKGDGVAVFYAQDLEKVPAQFEVARLNLEQDSSSLKDQLMRVQAALDYKNDVPKQLGPEDVLSPAEIERIQSIQDALRREDFSALIRGINTLDLNTKHSVNVSDISDLLEKSIEDLEEEKDALSKQIAESDIAFTTTTSEVVTFQMPVGGEWGGYSGHPADYNRERLQKRSQKLRMSQSGVVKKGQGLFRLINNFRWYLAVDVSQMKSLQPPKVGERVDLLYGKGQTHPATILAVTEQESGGIVIFLELEEGFESFIQRLRAPSSIVLEHAVALKFPATALVENHKQLGVYIEDIHGLVSFLPIELLGTIGDDVYVSPGDGNHNITVQDHLKKTVQLTDKVIVHPDRVEERQVIKEASS